MVDAGSKWAELTPLAGASARAGTLKTEAEIAAMANPRQKRSMIELGEGGGGDIRKIRVAAGNLDKSFGILADIESHREN